MIINYSLALLINDQLRKSGQRPKLMPYDGQFCIFMPEELEQIETIVVTGFENLDDLEKLPNLKRLIIKSVNYNAILPEVSYEDNPYVNHIKDFSVLSRLTSLEELRIENDLHVTSLDVRDLTKLKTLVLINNPNLVELNGLERLKQLDVVFMFGNNIHNRFDIVEYCKNTIMSTTNVLDISMYLACIKHNKKDAKELMNLDLAGLTSLEFSEKSGFLDYTLLGLQSLYDMYSKLDVYFRKNNVYDLSNEEKIMFVFKYLHNNIAFSEESIKERNSNYQEMINKYNGVPEQVRKNLSIIHNSYYAYHFRQGNCEGIVNLGVFMLRMLGIDAWNVHVHDLKENGTIGSNHALIRVDGYYYDPTYDRKNYMNYYMLNYDEISKYHMLDVYEASLHQGEQFKLVKM